MYQVSQFAVFGFNTFTQDIIDSNIFVTINYSILTGALLCIQCDVTVKQSNLQFTAQGLQVSALILKSNTYLQLYNVNISFRFKSNSSSGLVNQVTKPLNQFKIYQSIITGFNSISSQYNGYICSHVVADASLVINDLFVCVDSETKRIGQSLYQLTSSQFETLQCNRMCLDNQVVTYGICQQKINFATLVSNNTYVCADPFEYSQYNNSCVCKPDYYLNISVCVHVINQFTEIQRNMIQLEVDLKTEIHSTEANLLALYQDLEQMIQQNISNLSALAVSNFNQIINDISTTNQSINTKYISSYNQVDELKTTIVSNKNSLDVAFLQTRADISSTNISIKTRFDSVDLSNSGVHTKLDNIKTQITSSASVTQSQISNTQTQINNIRDQILSQLNGFASVSQVTSLKSDVIHNLTLMCSIMNWGFGGAQELCAQFRR
ncbi:Hypothetical_protein [Hexamita inflata]|uniref:Hypothetical_protein n=1 Tax=Hexamita inflata TaxID=28002 RepID=A0AA86UNY9_9EUKA|nr:Hypothetical protein HINF_LOCUS50007 [Hexamita inflata]CAI9962364.1 Hypothetical protein HINF_LOCUS50009 [Hexamita inflata]CAI9966236.1 Hypothetical protein HINF_LOCUS53881 [Hexamita inflata]